MPTSLIIGSGPAAAGAAMALVRDPNQQVTVLDIGGRLEPERVAIRDSMATAPEREWNKADLRAISHHAVPTESGALPEKRAYGSDFPFRDFGQLQGLRVATGANPSVISGAYGGFSNVWGAQIMPFSRATFSEWPITYEDMLPHYRVALDEMSLAGDEDDLAITFPLLTKARPLPELSERTRRVLARYETHRGRLQSLGVTVGRARLAFRADDCTRCGLCMTGCPYGLIYSASQTFDRLRSSGQVTYREGMMALRLTEADGRPEAEVRDLATGSVSRVSADRIFVACGGIGTTRLVLGSLGHFGQSVELCESVQFVMPTVSLGATTDPRNEQDFTLNQFNLVYDPGGQGLDLSQIHFYPYNPVFLTSLPAAMQHKLGQPMLRSFLRRVSVGLGYIPSWGSPKFRVEAVQTADGHLPELRVSGSETAGWPPMLRRLVTTMTRIAPALDLWPVLPRIQVSGAAKSYHFGGSFPHGSRSELGTDRVGRLQRWGNIHLVDASVFPTVPATTFTLTIMANAHRIATETLDRSLDEGAA